MNKDFDFHLRALFADFGDLFNRQFAREDDPTDALAAPEFDTGPVDDVCLNRQMNHLIWPFVFDHHNQTRIGHNQGVGLHLNHRLNITHIRRDL